MMFIVVLIALLIERFFDWSHLRQWGWFGACQRFAMQKLYGGSPYLILIVAILPLLAAVAIVQFCVAGVLYGITSLVLQLLVLMYCLGPQNLWADAFAAISALSKGETQTAAEKLKSAFQITSGQPGDMLQYELVGQIYIAAHQRIFAVLFWYAVLGLPGAVLYRLINVSTQMSSGPEISAAARNIESYLDWIPVRLMTFLFALGGNFTRVPSIWRKLMMLKPANNDLLLSECGLAAITSPTEKIPQDGSLEKSAVSLLDRVFIITLVIFAIMVFVI
jgi:AmpE protein